MRLRDSAKQAGRSRCVALARPLASPDLATTSRPQCGHRNRHRTDPMAAKKKASRGTKAFVDVFSPATYQRFSKTAKTVSGFRERHRKASERVEPGDKLLCYLTKLSRWVGVLEVESGPYDDEQPLFVEKDDP